MPQGCKPRPSPRGELKTAVPMGKGGLGRERMGNASLRRIKKSQRAKFALEKLVGSLHRFDQCFI